MSGSEVQWILATHLMFYALDFKVSITDFRLFFVCRTPLHYAAANGHKRAIFALIKNMSNQQMADPDVRDRAGRTPLHKVSILAE